MRELADALSDRAGTIEQVISETGLPLAETLRASTERLAIQTRASADILRAAVDEGAARTLADLAETNDRSPANSAASSCASRAPTRRWRASSPAADSNLGSIEKNLSDRLTQVQGELERVAAATGRAGSDVSAQVAALREASEGALRGRPASPAASTGRRIPSARSRRGSPPPGGSGAGARHGVASSNPGPRAWTSAALPSPAGSIRSCGMRRNGPVRSARRSPARPRARAPG